MKYTFLVLGLLATVAHGQLVMERDDKGVLVPKDPPSPVVETNKPPKTARLGARIPTPADNLARKINAAVLAARQAGMTVTASWRILGETNLVITIAAAMPDATVTNAIAKPFNDVLFRAQKRAAIKPHLPIASERDGDSVVLIYEDGRRETKTLKRAFSVRPEKALARKAIEAEVSRLMKEGDAKEVLQELQKVQLTIGSKEPSKPAIIGGRE